MNDSVLGNHGNGSWVADVQADARLVVSWVNDVSVPPSRSPSYAPGHHHSSSSDSESVTIDIHSQLLPSL
ncbi:hypothetical protein RSOLAG1IB_11938 [Rhizoctonia solani AG-1 IB]|uniref:Uncharacterized protein n=1 Tax=Thanatephorus cucumeris (strain AG1-IB / isolate 7/3/14) TaxID=1108050 RepID=A0A0B7FEK4_THACB|nr:hypothetical protein RSOLAG1IB_11938 [Rhizoctonia solani AG-1 IB]